MLLDIIRKRASNFICPIIIINKNITDRSNYLMNPKI